MSTGEIVQTITHGVATAGYYSDGEIYHPFMACSCGLTTHGSNSWEDVGLQFDEHIAELKILDFKPRKVLLNRPPREQ